MNNVTDPDLLNQLNGVDPNAAPPLTVQGPGNVTDPALLSALEAAPSDPAPTAPPQPSTWKDMARSVGSGLVKGAAAVPGMLGDATNFLGETLPSYAIAYGAQGLGLLPQGKTANDFLNDVAGNPTLQSAPTGGPLNAIANATSLPTGQSTLNAIQSVAGQPLPKPQTPAGQMTENVTSFIPQALGGEGNIARNAIAYGLLPGATSEAAGQSANSMLGSWADAPARMLGGGFGATAGHLGVAPSPVSHIISGATRGVSDADIASARTLQQSAAAQGISITPAEAIQHVTGGASNLGSVQRNLEGMSESAPILKSYFAQRPEQVQGAADRLFGQIAPYPASPSALGVSAQREAQGAMGDIRADRSAETAPFYQAAANDQVPQSRMAQVAANLDGMINDPANRGTPATGPLQTLRNQIVDRPAVAATDTTPAIPETYHTNVGTLDNIYGATRDAYSGAAPLGQSGTDARVGRVMTAANGHLNQALLDSSDNLAAGRATHGFMTDNWVAPREAAPIGQISQTNDLTAQGNSLYPSNPNIGSQAETQEAVLRLPQTAPGITRNYLEKAFNEANQNNMGGPNQWGGAKFAAQTFGNRQQAENLYAGLGALPNGSEISPQTKALVDALQATGQRQPMGSSTAFNEQFNTHMEAGTPLGNAVSLTASPEKALGFVRDWYQQNRIGTNAEAMARMLADPNGLAQIEAARAAVPPEAYRSVMAQLLAGRAGMTLPVAARNRSEPGQ